MEVCAGISKPKGDRAGHRPVRRRASNVVNIRAVAQDSAGDAAANSQFASGFCTQLFTTAMIGAADESAAGFAEDDFLNPMMSPREAVTVEPFDILEHGHLDGLQDEDDEESLFAAEFSALVMRTAMVQEADLEVAKDMAICALEAALPQDVIAWETLGCDDDDAPPWDQLKLQEGSTVYEMPAAPVAPPPIASVAWEGLGNDVDDLLTACTPQQAPQTAWESLTCDEDCAAPSWEELAQDGAAVREMPAAPIATASLAAVAWESLGNDADDLLTACVPQQPVAPKQVEASVVWEALGCDDDDAPAWEQLKPWDGSAVHKMPAAARAPAPLGPVAWESLGNDEDDLFVACVSQQAPAPMWEALSCDDCATPSWEMLGQDASSSRKMPDPAPATTPLVAVAWESLGNDEDDLLSACVPQQAPVHLWEELGCDGEETPAWEQLDIQDSVSFPSIAATPARIAGVAWESLGNDEDDVWAACVPYQARAELKQKVAPSIIVESEEPASPVSPPTPSKMKRRIIRDIPTLTPKEAKEPLPVEMLVSPPVISPKLRKRLTGSDSSPSLHSEKGLKFNFQDLKSFKFEASSSIFNTLAARSAAQPFKGSAMAADLALSAAAPATPTTWGRLSSSASTGMLPSLASVKGSKASMMFAPMEAAKRNRMWDLDRSLAGR